MSEVTFFIMDLLSEKRLRIVMQHILTSVLSNISTSFAIISYNIETSFKSSHDNFLLILAGIVGAYSGAYPSTYSIPNTYFLT